jgi:hypothetical protein
MKARMRQRIVWLATNSDVLLALAVAVVVVALDGRGSPS